MSAIFAAFVLIAGVVGLLAYLVWRSEVLNRGLRPFAKIVVVILVAPALTSAINLLPTAGPRGGRALPIDLADAG
jgi:hypothetical protein